ncbi:MAG TPA: DUF3397 family protein [Planococcus sp. (in: firmicutes)]|nr:DUF3397 family protein [Planococcus sp. (in: firmicutes)]
MIILQTVATIFIFAPFIAFFGIILLTRRKLKRKSIGLAADLTTFLLLFSVPVSIETVWGYSIAGILYSLAVLLAILLLIIEWKSSKEIEVLKYIQKTWRIYFLVFCTAYVMVWLSGLTQALFSLL